MNGAFLAVAPVFIVIALGWTARASGVLPREQWAGINQLAYWAFFPAMLFSVIARADFAAIAAGPFLLASIGGFVSTAFLVLVLKPFLRSLSGPTFTSLLQGSFRWNLIILVAVVEPVYGPEATALAALMAAPVVPLVNVICVGALSVWGEGAAPSWKTFARRLATNPLILACLLGFVANVAGIAQSGPIADALSLLGQAAIAASLMGVGAGIDLTALGARRNVLALSTAMKLLVMPAVLWVWALTLGLPPLATAVLVLAGATPSASASYVLARELGGDAPLTAGNVTATLLLSALTLPLWMLLVTPN
ncbi:MAG: AEC family transporter [Maricaulaceae bacterium]|jgi:predicted permease